MPVQCNYHQSSHQSNFVFRHRDQFEEWINSNHTFTTPSGEVINFDEAYVVNGLHSTTSTADPNPSLHVTVQMSNPALRSRNQWYTLHWRPNGGSVYANQVMDREKSEKTQEKRRLTKLRRRARKEQNKKDTDDNQGGSAGTAAAPAVK